MGIVTLNGELRSGVGKGPARQTRRAERIPGVIYGKGESPLPLSLGYKEFLGILQTGGANVILDLKLAGAEAVDRKALVRDLQRDPVSGQIIHVDLQHISLTEKITVEVPLHVSGVAIGVKDYGGILEFIVRNLEIECLPTDIPESITIDVSALMVHDALHVRDIAVPNARVLTDPDQVVVTIVSPTVEKAPGAPEEAAAAAEPEVIGKKKEDEGAPAEGEAKAEKKEKK